MSKTRARSQTVDKKKSQISRNSKKIQKQPKNTTKRRTTKSEATKATRRTTRAKGSAVEREKSPTPPKKKVATKKRTRRAGHEIPESVKTPIRAIKVTKGNITRGYTPEQYTEYKKQVKELQTKSNAELSEILKKNKQVQKGTKADMASRVADGRILGQIPKCPECKGGRPRFDFRSAMYLCPGFQDLYEFVPCHKRFTMDEIKRKPWKE